MQFEDSTILKKLNFDKVLSNVDEFETLINHDGTNNLEDFDHLEKFKE